MELFGLSTVDKLQITGTPSYVVGKEVVFGALGQDVLSEKISAAAAACGHTAWRAGSVRREGQRKAVEIPPLGITYESDSLQLR